MSNTLRKMPAIDIRTPEQANKILNQHAKARVLLKDGVLTLKKKSLLDVFKSKKAKQLIKDKQYNAQRFLAKFGLSHWPNMVADPRTRKDGDKAMKRLAFDISANVEKRASSAQAKVKLPSNPTQKVLPKKMVWFSSTVEVREYEKFSPPLLTREERIMKEAREDGFIIFEDDSSESENVEQRATTVQAEVRHDPARKTFQLTTNETLMQEEMQQARRAVQVTQLPEGSYATRSVSFGTAELAKGKFAIRTTTLDQVSQDEHQAPQLDVKPTAGLETAGKQSAAAILVDTLPSADISKVNSDPTDN